MAPSSRDRISVDLQGLKTALFDRAQALGMSPSLLVRTSVAEALGRAVPLDNWHSRQCDPGASGDRVRLCLRMGRAHARATVDAARRAGLNPGDYVAGLVANVPVLATGGSFSDYLIALTASSAELAALSRSIRGLTALLREVNVEPARPYRAMLDTLSGDVRRHLELAARALADLQARRRGTGCAARDGD